MEIKLDDFLKNPYFTIEFYNEGRIPIMLGAVTAEGSCIDGTWFDGNNYQGVTVYGGRRVLQPFEYVENKSINLSSYLNTSKIPCEINLITAVERGEIVDPKLIGYKISLK